MTPVTDVVVTGLGATTPLGGDVASTWRAALAGESGARAEVPQLRGQASQPDRGHLPL
jgi:3-oxoacyl-(acyl-carrier-protein) synthase